MATPAPTPRRRRRRPVYRVAGTIDVRENGSELVEARLERLRANATSEHTIMAAQVPVQNAIRRLFLSRGEGVWKPTSEETTARKRARGQRTEPMRATDRLFLSLVNPHARGAIRRTLKRNTQLRVSSRFPEIIFQARRGRLATHVDQRGRDEATRAISEELMRR